MHNILIVGQAYCVAYCASRGARVHVVAQNPRICSSRGRTNEETHQGCRLKFAVYRNAFGQLNRPALDEAQNLIWCGR